MRTLLIIIVIISLPFVYWSGNKEGYKEGYSDGYTDMCIIHNSVLLKTDTIHKIKYK